MNKKKLLAISLFILLLLILVAIKYLSSPKVVGDVASNGVTKSVLENQAGETEEEAIQEVVNNLEIPWEIVFLPDQTMLATERPGRLVHIKPTNQEKITVEGVRHVGEGGLLGMTLHPEYEQNGWIYLYLTSNTTGSLENRVERYTFNEDNSTLSEWTVILDLIPGAIYHDGGKITFGPDNMLYITTGDAGNTANAQNTNSLAGKILRISDSGEIPQDNPFGNAVYSYGHRNPQGIAWDTNGNMWSSEHGPSGVNTGFDEINFIIMGNNYGWPTITGLKTNNSMVSPVIQSGSDDTWAPGGVAIHEDTLFFTGLRGESLYSAKISGSQLTNFTKHFEKEFGRLRAITLDPTNEWLYISTSNRDGRGTVNENDDKIIKIRLDAILQ